MPRAFVSDSTLSSISSEILIWLSRLRRVCIRREDGTYCVTHVLERIWPVREERIRKEFPENVRRIETYI